MNVLRVGIAGLGGYAGVHHRAVRYLEEQGVCQLIATCDPDLEGQRDAISKFGLIERGVRLLGTYEQMLDEALDAVLLPTPIPLHAQQHRLAIERGLGVYLEKPPTLWWPEFLAMMEAEAKARFATQVGFNFVGDPLRLEIKRRILAGEFGKVEGATFLAIWPRDLAYYQRNNWAGRMEVNGHPVRDSCIGNALAHNIQDLLFWCGDGIAEIQSVQARLFHAHPIESFDTAFVRAELDGGAWLRIGVTHAGADAQLDREQIFCSRAMITFDRWHHCRIEHQSGDVEELQSSLTEAPGTPGYNIGEYFAYLRGERGRPITTLEDSRSFVALNNLTFLSAGEVESFAPERVISVKETGQVVVAGLEKELERFVDHGDWPDREPKPASSQRLEELLG